MHITFDRGDLSLREQQIIGASIDLALMAIQAAAIVRFGPTAPTDPLETRGVLDPIAALMNQRLPGLNFRVEEEAPRRPPLRAV